MSYQVFFFKRVRYHGRKGRRLLKILWVKETPSSLLIRASEPMNKRKEEEEVKKKKVFIESKPLDIVARSFLSFSLFLSGALDTEGDFLARVTSCTVYYRDALCALSLDDITRYRNDVSIDCVTFREGRSTEGRKKTRLEGETSVTCRMEKAVKRV